MVMPSLRGTMYSCWNLRLVSATVASPWAACVDGDVQDKIAPRVQVSAFSASGMSMAGTASIKSWTKLSCTTAVLAALEPCWVAGDVSFAFLSGL